MGRFIGKKVPELFFNMTKKIMTVDDEEDLRELLKGIFTSEGFEVIAASSGEECLEILKTEKPDLILMDMMMPNMTGRQTIEKIRENPLTKDLKIALLSVVDSATFGEDKIKKLKILDYITKPYENDDLVTRVKKIIT